MTGQEMIAALRYRLDDTVGADANKMWTDGELISYMDTIQSEIAEECRVLHTSAIIPCVSGDATFDAGEFVLEVEDAVLIVDAQRVPLGKATMHDFVVDGKWPNPETGTPLVMAPVDSNGAYAFDKELDFDADLYLLAVSLPAALVDDTSTISIPSKYHGRMLNGILKLCFLKPDKETFSQTKADLFDTMYAADKEYVKRIENKVKPRAIKYVTG